MIGCRPLHITGITCSHHAVLVGVLYNSQWNMLHSYCKGVYAIDCFIRVVTVVLKYLNDN